MGFNVDIQVNLNNIKNVNKFKQAITQAVQRISIKLTNKVKSDKLTGQVLKVQTGRLRNSIQSRVETNGDVISGIVSTNVKYARVHEYGFNGPVTIRQHMRNVKQAFGKPISPRSVSVSSHQRTMRMPQRSFMRTALAEMRQEAISEIKNAIRQV